MPHTPPPAEPSCPLCTGVSGRVVWHCAAWRVVHADSPAENDFPVFYRLVSNAHYTEWTDVPDPLRLEGMDILACIETAMRQQFQPRKINLASLGNQAPHVHWHIIARFDWDSHFPNPVWGATLRNVDARHIEALREQLPAFEAALAKALLPFKDVD
ncbi:MAG: HIT family protein [Brachymonas sp.]|nr:HIT family protein [Brachymonas sp.]